MEERPMENGIMQRVSVTGRSRYGACASARPMGAAPVTLPFGNLAASAQPEVARSEWIAKVTPGPDVVLLMHRS